MYDLNIKMVGQKIKEYRKAKNMTIEQLGNLIGKSKTTVARYENSELALELTTLLEICNALHIDFNDICTKVNKSVQKNNFQYPFSSNLLYLYYISRDGIVISELDIENKGNCYYVRMKNGLCGNRHKQEYVGLLEYDNDSAFFCLSNTPDRRIG